MSMWEPFTAQARDAMVEAQKVAEQHGDSFISHHHIFIAICDAPDVAAILAGVGVDSERAKEAGAAALGEEGAFASPKEMTFTSQAKRMIELAFENARKLENNFIGAEHLALGYIDLGPKCTQIIAALGIDAKAFRDMLIASLEKKPKHRPGTPHPQSKHSLEDCFAWLGRRKFGALLPEAMWDALSGAAAEKDLGAAIAYALLIAHQNGWSAQETAAQVLHAAKRRFQN